MNTHFEILIDASGSMGYMTGAGQEHENKYLLPDGSTRTSLVKKILINTIIPKLSFSNCLTVSNFRNEFDLDKYGKRIIISGKYKDHPVSNLFYSGYYDSKMINSIISKIENPEPGGTPLFWALSVIINQKEKDNFNIIVLSDGDANDREQFDLEVLKQIKEANKKCKIYFIGIDQDEIAQKKSKNLADKTNGFYVNLNAIDYNEKMFDSLLFEWNTTITSNALKENLKIETPLTITEPIKTNSDAKEGVVIKAKEIKEAAVEVTKPEAESNEIEKQTIEEIEPPDLKNQVEENTKSLKLITSQLDSIVKEISFIRKGNSTEVDEFLANEDETYNRAIGYKCEEHLFTQHLKKFWKDANWLNELEEQSKPYDFEIIVKGVKYFIECKGSVNNSEEFFLTKNEWQFYLQNRNNYRLYFVSEINSDNPTIIKIEDLIKSMEKGELIPCSSVNRKVKADRILFQIISN